MAVETAPAPLLGRRLQVAAAASCRACLLRAAPYSITGSLKRHKRVRVLAAAASVGWAMTDQQYRQSWVCMSYKLVSAHVGASSWYGICAPV